MSKQTNQLAVWIGGVLSIVLTLGYIALLFAKVNVPSTYVVVLVAAVTHFLGTVAPAAVGNVTITQLIEALAQSLGVSISTSTPTATTTATTHPTTTTTAPTPSSVHSDSITLTQGKGATSPGAPSQ